MSAHTPGPWEVLEGTDMIFTVGSPYGNGPMHVADVRGWGHMTGRGGGLAWSDDKALAVQLANARLIAAAPDLLEALTAAREYVAGAYECAFPDDYVNAAVLAQIDAAIAKVAA